MVDSYGTPTPSTFWSAGPTPDLLVDKTALANVKFDPTPEGMQVMAIMFPAALGAMYAHYFNTAIAAKDFTLHTQHDERRSQRASTTSSSRPWRATVASCSTLRRRMGAMGPSASAGSTRRPDGRQHGPMGSMRMYAITARRATTP